MRGVEEGGGGGEGARSLYDSRAEIIAPCPPPFGVPHLLEETETKAIKNLKSGGLEGGGFVDYSKYFSSRKGYTRGWFLALKLMKNVPIAVCRRSTEKRNGRFRHTLILAQNKEI